MGAVQSVIYPNDNLKDRFITIPAISVKEKFGKILLLQQQFQK